MLLKQIKLHNIRSYVSETITFPKGSVLLAGDIGSGKSSILLALEFALFGISRGVLSGNSLLRVGAQKGSVELFFSSNNQEIVIKRTLKRKKEDVRQQAGYILINGQKQKLTPLELKSKILDILGYPQNLLTKSKSLIFRYTVYTPQEAMKRILMEHSKYRLDTLRKLFQIDKYKQIRENSSIISSLIKKKLNVLEGQLQDIEEKKQQYQEKKLKAKQTKKKLQAITARHKHKVEQLQTTKQKVKQIENKITMAQQIKKQYDLLNIKLQQKIARRSENKEKLEQIKKFLSNNIEKINKIKVEKLINVEILRGKQSKLQDKINKVVRKEVELTQLAKVEHQKINETKNSLEKIKQLDKCPTCRQNIDKNHINHIQEKNNQVKTKAKKLIEKYNQEKTQVKEQQSTLKSSIEQIKSKIKKAIKTNEQFREKQNLEKSQKQKQSELESLEEQQTELKKQIGKINSDKLGLSEQLKEHKESSEELKKAKQELENTQKQEKTISLEKTKIQTQLSNIIKNMQNIADELEKKKQAKKTQKRLKQRLNWLDKLFVNLMVEMEQQVMFRVYNEFNEIFQEFFKILIGDQIMVRLDDEFNPIIEQQGYDIEYEDLSGGEKTSLALAYRLALNKVVNDLIQNIKTKELIILDEPTDGFSSYQLDKIRDVLNLLACKQTIIVSHESKIESYVDNIIKIEKKSNISTINPV